MSNLIEIENLTFKYRPNGEREGKEAYTALDGISLNIEGGSFVAIVGHNGSGKSTLAKCINALLLPDGGSVKVAGYDTTDGEHTLNIRQRVGMVFQNPDNQIVSSIVEDDIAFGPENLGVEPSEIRRRVDESLKAVEMDGFQRSAPHLLSGGQKQRIAIASAMAMRPECIIFDEPTAMLDPRGRREVMEIIKKLNAEGITCILITHSMEEAAKADRIIALEEGRIVMDCAPEEIFSDREKLEVLDLEMPMVVDLGFALKDAGVEVPTGISDEEEFVEALCRLK